jgi:hypothetical protein
VEGLTLDKNPIAKEENVAKRMDLSQVEVKT